MGIVILAVLNSDNVDEYLLVYPCIYTLVLDKHFFYKQ